MAPSVGGERTFEIRKMLTSVEIFSEFSNNEEYVEGTDKLFGKGYGGETLRANLAELPILRVPSGLEVTFRRKEYSGLLLNFAKM